MPFHFEENSSISLDSFGDLLLAEGQCVALFLVLVWFWGFFFPMEVFWQIIYARGIWKSNNHTYKEKLWGFCLLWVVENTNYSLVL